MEIKILVNSFNLALQRKQLVVKLPFSKKILVLLELLYAEGFIDYFLLEGSFVSLTFSSVHGNPVLKEIHMESRGASVLYKDLFSLYSTSFCVVVLNTSKGLITHRDALVYGVGGKVFCYLYF